MAMREQPGLKVSYQRAVVDYYVIDGGDEVAVANQGYYGER
jgi:hypothetical protein